MEIPMSVHDGGAPRPGRAGKRSFERRLAGYALAGGAVLGAAESAEADIVWSGPQDIPIGSAGSGSYNLDLTGTGTTDYTFNFSSGIGFFGPFEQLAIDTIPGSFTNAVVSTDGSNADRLTFGSSIGPGSPFASGTSLNIQTDYKFFGSSGNWAGRAGYLGFQFQIGDPTTHYGWAELDLTNGPADAVLLGWAYESTPDTGIIAGAVPEPASLGLLAAGRGRRRGQRPDAPPRDRRGRLTTGRVRSPGRAGRPSPQVGRPASRVGKGEGSFMGAARGGECS